jgi:Ca2+-binding RTX toxin-like protein
VGVSDFDPAFSPDGRSILFVRDVGNCELFTMPASGGAGTNISNTPALDECDPVFSPDGKRIAYDVDDGPNNEIYTMNADGSAQTNITNTAPPVGELSPSWQSIQRCGGRLVTIVGDDGPDRIKGTKKADVIASFGGNDTVKGLGGSDRMCGGKGKDRLVGGDGPKDLCSGGAGKDRGSSCEKGKL